MGWAALFPHRPWATQGTVIQLCLLPSHPVQHWADSSSRVFKQRDPHRFPSDSCSPAEVKSQQLQLREAAIWASKEIPPAMPSFWLPSVHPPQLSPCTGVLPLAGQPEFLAKPFWCKSQLRVALQKHLGLHPQSRLVHRAFAGRASVCM